MLFQQCRSKGSSLWLPLGRCTAASLLFRLSLRFCHLLFMLTVQPFLLMFKIKNGSRGKSLGRRQCIQCGSSRGSIGGCLPVDSKSEPNSPEPVTKVSVMALMQMKDCIYTKDRSSVCLMRWFSEAQVRIKWPLVLGKTCNGKASAVTI